MGTKRPQPASSHKKIIIITILGAAMAIIYFPIIKSWMFDRPREVAEDAPSDDVPSTGEAEAGFPAAEASRSGPGNASPLHAGRPSGAAAAPPREAFRSQTGDRLFGAAESAGRDEKTAINPREPVLSGILDLNGARCAIIDGKTVRPGDKVSGAWIEEIQPRQVLLKSGGELKTLQFPQAEAAGSAGPRQADPKSDDLEPR